MTLKGRPCPACGRPLPETAEEKLDRLVDRSGGPDACWPYRGRLNVWGYGVIDVWVGRRVTQVRAHRVAYEQHFGPLGDLAVLHLCDERSARGDPTYRRCCNPAHLAAGTIADNHDHMWRVGRQQTYLGRARGESVGTAVLTDAGVLEMRRRFAAGETGAALAAAYGVTQGTAWKAIHGVSFAHLSDAQPHPGQGRGSRGSRGHDPATQVRGERAPNARLTDAGVLELRRRYAAGETAVALAQAFGVSATVGYNAIHGITWGHVPEAQPHDVRRRGWPKGKPRGPRKPKASSAPPPTTAP